MTQGVFRSINEALTFAFRHTGQASPQTPMSRMQPGGLGSGKGLVGLDGAGQAGMIMSALNRQLNAEQHLVILVRFGAGLEEACPCCGVIGQPKWWREAVSALSLTEPIKDLPKAIREAIVMKTVARKRLRVQNQADGYEVTERQIRRRVSSAKAHFAKIENAAIGVLQAHFADTQLLEAA